MSSTNATISTTWRRTAAASAVATALWAVACSGGEQPELVLTGLVDATEIDVASKIAGRIKESYVREGDRVVQGQRLVAIESQEVLAKLDQVRAGVDATRAKLKMARRGARAEEKRAVRRSLQAARHQRDMAKKMYDRMNALRESNAIPQAKYDEYEFKYQVAQEQLAMAEAKHALVMKGARGEEIEALEALVAKGEHTLSEVESYSSETTQSAPIAGEVAEVILHRGELAAPGFPILTIVDLDNVWAAFALREDRLKRVKKGDTVRLEVPALGKTVPMKVFHIAAMGDFATWRATTERSDFDLKSFTVKARPEKPVKGLRPGMTVRWRFD